MSALYTASPAPSESGQRSWRQPPHARERWLGKTCVLVAWVGLLLALLSPPEGPGITLCWLQGATGLPCPGCGLTRSLSCALRGLLAESWSYHPLGPAILVLFVLTAAYSLCPRRIRDRLARRVQSHAAMANTVYWGFVVLFIGFGLARVTQHAVTGWLNHGP